jgi:photosystem II stability/assembly factor-like uncharacterized protein
MPRIFPRKPQMRPAALTRVAFYVAIGLLTGWATFTTYSAKLDETKTPAAAAANNPVKPSSATQRVSLNKEYGKLPLSFEANTGQTDSSVKYFARGAGYNVFFTAEEAVLVLPGVAPGSPSSDDEETVVSDDEPKTNHSELIKMRKRLAEQAAVPPTVIRMRLERSNSGPPAVTGGDELPGKVSYFFGNDSSKWRTNVSTYGKVTYNKVYPGIDLVYYGNRQQLEYDLVLQPGADPSAIKLKIDGAESMRIDRKGNLILKTKSGDLEQLKPAIYQEADGVRKEIKGSYVLHEGNKVGFRVSRYDRRKELIIDPVLRYLSMVNGSGESVCLTTDAAGNTYIAGLVFDTDLNPTPGAYQIISGGFADAFVTKLNATGSGVLYTTYLGGTFDDFVNGITVDSSGNAYLAGGTSGSFPTTPGAFQSSAGGFIDGFLTKLNPTGSSLVFSTRLGGNGYDEVDSVFVDAGGAVYISGLTGSTNMPATVGAFRTTFSGGLDGFAAKMNSGATALTYLTYYGGGGFDYPTNMAVDAAGNFYFSGQTTSLNLPTQNAIQPTMGGNTRGFFKTSNAGTTWALSNTNNQTGYVFAIAINPTTPSIIYAGTDGGVIKSTDGGATWSNTGPMPARWVRSLLFDPSNPNTIYAGANEGVFRSTDGGNTWVARSNGLINPALSVDVRGLASNVSQPNTIYAAHLSGTFKTTDGGANWSAITTGLPSSTNSLTNALVVDPTSINIAYIAIVNAQRVFKTTNGGTSWAAAATGLPNTQVNGLAINPTTPQTLYAATNIGVYKTTNGGTNWAVMNNGLLLPRTDGNATNPPINCIAIDPSNPNTVYAVASTQAAADGSFYSFATVFKSTDGGANWTPQTSGFNNAHTTFASVAVDPSNSANVYAGSFGDADAFFMKLNASGSSLAFSSYFGGDRVDSANGVAIDSANNLYMLGNARGFGFPTTAGAFQTTLAGNSDAFVAKLSNAGALVYSTLIGGNDVETSAGGLAVDATGNAYLTGATFSTNFPVTPGAFQSTIGNPGVRAADVFVAKLNPAGSGLIYASYLGGGGNDVVNGFVGSRLSIDSSLNAYLTGVTTSPNFPAFDFVNSGVNTRTFVGKIDGTVATYNITGRVTTAANAPVAGVRVQASTSLDVIYDGITDAQGYYNIINVPPGDYVVTPDKYGTNGHYLFAPPSINLPGFSSNQTANFTATQVYDIFGQVTSSTVLGLGIFDVTINLTGSATRSTTSDANGQFVFQDLLPGNYTVTPNKPGFTFNPTSLPFNNLAGDQFAPFTTASTPFFTISGRVATPGNAGIGNATVSLFLRPQRGQTTNVTTTDANGNYSFSNVQSGGVYTLMAANPLMTFTPPTAAINNLISNQTVNFTSGPVTGLIGKLAFVTLAGLNVMNADTTGETTLTPLSLQCSSDESQPSWSPDGSTIAFADCNGVDNNIYLIKADGTGRTQITNDPTGEIFPSWAPDGNQITYTYGECSGTDHVVPDVFAISPAGTNRTNLTNTGIVDGYSDWSPNGSRIVFTRAQSVDCSSVGSDDADLYTIKSIGGGDVQLTNTPSAEINPKYSPDGSKIAFVREFEDTANGVFGESIYVMDADGSNVVKLTPDNMLAVGPTWSPDGTKIAFTASSGGPSQIFVINADGTGLAQLTAPPTLRESVAWQHYSISGHITGNTDGPVTMVLAGTLSRVTQTNANGDYVFGNLTPGGNYSVSPVSTAFTYTPAKADVNNLVGNQTANFTVQAAVPAPTPPLSDDFGGTQRDPLQWNLGTLTQPMLAFDPAVTVVQQNGQLVITPLTNVPGLHYNGYVSVNSFDFTNATLTAHVTQVASGTADTIFAIGTDLDNFSRFRVKGPGSEPNKKGGTPGGVAQLIFEVRISGSLTSLTIPYDPVAHAYFRFRHDPLPNDIVFETSPDDKDFTERHRVTLARGVQAQSAELSAGTSGATTPGAAAFGSVQLVTNTFQFAQVIGTQPNVNTNEGAGRVELTITRIGSTVSPATVEFITRDTAGLNNCNVFNGIASSRCDYATSIGSVRFEIGQTTKTISVPLVDDGFAEGPETFTVSVRNANGAGIGTPSRSIVTIADNDSATGANPIDTTNFFVRQQYVDFLSREPDPAGFAGWVNLINNCPAGDITCDRINVSSAFFRSAEFQGRGYFVYRFYPVAYGRKPDYNEFMPDLAKVSGFLSDQQLEEAKVSFINEFMSRPAFVAKFNLLNDTQYVDTLLATAQITSPNRDFWIAALGNGTRTRATVLRDISESLEVYNKYFNQAFVVMQYFGYLRRDPDIFYLNWIEVLDTTGDFRGMVFGFSNSLEYRFRFGP